MATQTVTTYWCDACLERGQEVEASASRSIAVDEVRVVLDFCERHDTLLIGALRDVALAHGRSAADSSGPRPKGTRTWATLICPDCGRGCVGGTGLAVHRRAAHGVLAGA